MKWQLLSRRQESAEQLIERALDAQRRSFARAAKAARVLRVRTVLAQRMRMLRVQADLTRAEVAKIAGASERLIGRWEDALSEPSCDHLVKLARHFRVSTDSLIGRAPFETGLAP